MSDSSSEQLGEFSAEFDRHFGAHLTPGGDVPPELAEAMRHSALAPGKRLRPFLVIRCCELCGGSRDDAWSVAAAVECVHAFSLIHDDLPCMDDDDLRRGRPTCHKQFDEATAILAGDALVVLGFELLTRQERDNPVSAEMILELARGIGWEGMIGGQMADIYGQTRPPSLELTRSIHQRKTARLFESACVLGSLAGGGDPHSRSALRQFGRRLGLTFQIADDLLDLTSTAGTLGKSVGKDAAANKQTFPQCVGLAESIAAAKAEAEAAVASLETFGPTADDLRRLVGYVVDRDY